MKWKNGTCRIDSLKNKRASERQRVYIFLNIYIIYLVIFSLGNHFVCRFNSTTFITESIFFSFLFFSLLLLVCIFPFRFLIVTFSASLSRSLYLCFFLLLIPTYLRKYLLAPYIKLNVNNSNGIHKHKQENIHTTTTTTTKMLQKNAQPR